MALRRTRDRIKKDLENLTETAANTYEAKVVQVLSGLFGYLSSLQTQIDQLAKIIQEEQDHEDPHRG